MNQREKDIQELCRQVMRVLLDMNPNNRKESCVFCGNGTWNASGMEDIKHEKGCAYLIAKDLSRLNNITL